MNNITIIGIGKIGLGFSLLLENCGYNVLGVDIFPEYVENLNKKNYKTFEPFYEELLLNSKNFKATLSLQEGLDFSDLIFIIVQTPNGGNDKFYDHSILSNLLEKINKLKPKNKNFIIGCTVMPKYINQIGKLLISDCDNCYLSYNPEFVAQGEIIKGIKNPDIIVIGTDNTNLEPIMREIYTKIVIKTPINFYFLKPIEAEIVKIALNGFITTKISYANMISDLCDNLDADKYKVLESIGSDSRIGNKYFKPGYSFGGPCFPRDTMALKHFAEQNNIVSDILVATTKYNNEHIKYQTQQLIKQNLEHYIIENVCYKENTKIAIIEESAKLKIARELIKFGKTVTIYDSKEVISEVKKDYGNIFNYKVKEDNDKNI
jgi:nucleotide sugar dehydrogenase